jgi:RNA polymerase sigma factor (sigma-70 family)
MRSLLDRLDPKYADVVRLRLDGVSFAEIAERLGVEEATVRQRLSRVLRTLSESHRDGD